MTIDMISELTEAGNYLFVVGSVAGLLFVGKWMWDASLSGRSRQIVFAWVLMFLSIGIHRAYWALALKMSSPIESYHPWFEHWKWVMTLGTGTMFLVGMIQFIHATRALPPKTRPLLFGVIAVLAVGITLLPPP